MLMLEVLFLTVDQTYAKGMLRYCILGSEMFIFLFKNQIICLFALFNAFQIMCRKKTSMVK